MLNSRIKKGTYMGKTISNNKRLIKPHSFSFRKVITQQSKVGSEENQVQALRKE